MVHPIYHIRPLLRTTLIPPWFCTLEITLSLKRRWHFQETGRSTTFFSLEPLNFICLSLQEFFPWHTWKFPWPQASYLTPGPGHSSTHGGLHCLALPCLLRHRQLQHGSNVERGSHGNLFHVPHPSSFGFVTIFALIIAHRYQVGV